MIVKVIVAATALALLGVVLGALAGRHIGRNRHKLKADAEDLHEAFDAFTGDLSEKISTALGKLSKRGEEEK